MSGLLIQALTGARLKEHLPDVVRLRIEVFRAFPYLYDGDTAYEERYIAAFAASADAVVIGAFDGSTLVGASTAAPLATQMDDVVAPFRARGGDLASLFYFGESVLRPAYRGHGVGVRFFEEREAHARACGATVSAFCSVVRAAEHPMQPRDYVPLDEFWRKRGYAPVSNLTCRMSWREVGHADETRKTMQFWTKRLTP